MSKNTVAGLASFRKIAMAACVAVAGFAAGSASADGEFLQFDLADGAKDGVVSITRGRVSVGATYSQYDGGSAANLALTWAIPLGQAGTVRIGPSFGQAFGDSGDDDPRFGGKVVFERWSPAPFGHLFLLGEYNTIDNNYFGLVQTGFGQSGFAAEVTVGGSDKYEAVTAGLTKRLGDSPVYLRAGYKFIAETGFVGLAINTF